MRTTVTRIVAMINCPVCGYDRLTEPLRWSFCPSCGTEFGYSDRGRSYDVLRASWLREGARWDSEVIPQPPNWDPIAQLRNINYIGTATDVEDIERVRATSDREM